MRHLLEYSHWDGDKGSKYTVTGWERADKDEEDVALSSSEIDELGLEASDMELDFFNVRLEDENNEEHTVAVNFQIFLEFLKKEMPNLESYLSNLNLGSIDEMFDDLESLGISFDDMIQKWVDENVTEETLDVEYENEEGEGSFVDDEGNIYSDEYDDEDLDDFGDDDFEDEE